MLISKLQWKGILGRQKLKTYLSPNLAADRITTYDFLPNKLLQIKFSAETQQKHRIIATGKPYRKDPGYKHQRFEQKQVLIKPQGTE